LEYLLDRAVDQAKSNFKQSQQLFIKCCAYAAHKIQDVSALEIEVPQNQQQKCELAFLPLHTTHFFAKLLKITADLHNKMRT